MPRIMRLLIRQTIIGFVLSALFIALLYAMNVANLWYLVTHSTYGVFATLILWVLNGIVFASVQFGIAVMRLGDDEDSRPGGGHAQPVPVPAEAAAPRTLRL
ncbi:hypothetical protein [Pseudoponticoccus marisrubri]|uniref:Uncharacterized protein n=1 Tax=Pseudoponticoccus marisrubri TaxID=1685382 RepID=A0A0W7WNV1_9RHOB|nr:hypothetical protein [Pseudoponticoccus marisrubri]KUF12265.1 hypothetical protein AVJ23_00580 [Pseudoponticoccus marisrubri]